MEPAEEIPMQSMTLKGDTEFPRALKDIMLGMRLQGEAIYKGFLVWHDGRMLFCATAHVCPSRRQP